MSLCLSKVYGAVSMSEVTRLLDSVERGDLQAAEELLPLVYGELRRLAHMKMAQLAPGQTLQPTALVHEVFLRLVGSLTEHWQSRQHFFAAAAEAMRHLLIDRARSKLSLRHGGGQVRIDLDHVDVAVESNADTLLLVNEALDRLAVVDSNAAEFIKLRYFVGLRHAEIAEVSADPRDESASLLAVADASLSESPGTVIGRYRLLEQIGEGGFGVVYMAEQTEPVRRKVALKIVKLGMDTRQVIARFEAERQALAMMDHPHIAKVHDAGATENGRPYFVMELIRGIPIPERGMRVGRQMGKVACWTCRALSA